MKDMKKIYTMAAGFLLCAGLVSCEMKKELFDNEEIPTETGLVELGVEVDDKTNVVITKAEATEGDEELGTTVETDDFPVSFTLKTNTNYNKELIYSDIKGKTVELPIGTYEVVSHTPGEMGKQMSTPYYKGSNELTVTKEATQQAKVTCTMQNSRIAVVYPQEFQDEFSEWTITIDDGTGNVLKFIYDKEHTNLNPDAIYWAIAENCSSISISIKATTKSGASVSETRSVTKPADAADKNWVGGDALTITMKPVEANTGHVSGITIDIDAFFKTEKGETVEAPLGDEETETPTDPDEGDEDGNTTEGPSITSDYLESGISYTIKLNPDWDGNGLATKYNVVNAPEKAEVTISAPKGFESIHVKINAQGGFAIAAGAIGLTKGINILNPEELDESLMPLLNLPIADDATSYKLDIANFFSMMAMYGPTGASSYDFEITVTDKEETSVGPETLSVTISEVSE